LTLSTTVTNKLSFEMLFVFLSSYGVREKEEERGGRNASTVIQPR
jgi:hypothetical protein